MNRLFDPRVITALLVALILLDVVYVAVIAVSPATWFKWVHGTAVDDPEGFLRRTAAVWASFATFQAIALARWRKHPHWLMFVAGIRSTEAIADWVFVASARDLTWGGGLGLLVASPINTFCTWYFFRAYLRARETSHPG